MTKKHYNLLIFNKKISKTTIISAVLLLVCFAILQINISVLAQTAPTFQKHGMQTLQTQNFDELGLIAEQFLIEKTKDLPGQTEIIITPLESRHLLPFCAKPIPYLSQGAKLWGKTTVAVRCENPNWRVMVKAQIKINTPYVTAVNTLVQGHVITEADLTSVTGDITSMRDGVLTDKNQLIGKTVARTIQAGSPIWQESLRAPKAIQQGQTIRIISRGNGFFITREGFALNSAGIGEVAKAKLENGTIIRGIAKEEGLIEIKI